MSFGFSAGGCRNAAAAAWFAGALATIHEAKASDQQRADLGFDVVETITRCDGDAGDARIADPGGAFSFMESLSLKYLLVIAGLDPAIHGAARQHGCAGQAHA